MATTNFDMISLLPESLIIIIISLLPFPESVRTSILSKTWANAKLFKKTTNVEFNEHFFVKSDDQPLHQREEQRRAFLHFITTWIHDPNHQEGTVDRFCLRLSMDDNVIGDYDIARKCIAFATQHKVKELELNFSSLGWYENDNPDKAELFNYLSFVPSLFELPKEVYKHTCLQSLKLYKCAGFDENGFNKFHALKEVCFGFMGVSVNAINNMLSNCKVLESLSLIKCWSVNSNFDIRDENGMLRNLVIEWCVYKFLNHTFVRVVAPNLKFFKYCGAMNKFDIKGGVEETYLDFISPFVLPGSEVRIYRLMKDLYDVKVLTICSHFLWLITWGREFSRDSLEHSLNIRHLTMRMKLLDKNEYYGITTMLRSCPVLEYLTIELNCAKVGVNSEKIIFGYYPMKYLRRSNARVCYESIESSLKVVEVKGFKGFNEYELRVIESFIRYGKCLKKMNINIAKDENKGMDVDFQTRQLAESLLSIPRASSDLEITIS